MTVSELGYTLSALINEKSVLALPGLGFFSLDTVEPQFIRNRCALTPPSSKIIFSAQSCAENTVASSTSSIKNDTSEPAAATDDAEVSDCSMAAKNPIAEYYSSEKGVDYGNALEQLQTLCKGLSDSLQAQAFITIPEFGTVRYGKGDDFVFEPCGTLLFNLDNWGLEIIGTSVFIKEQPQPGAIESQPQAPSKPQLNTVESQSWTHIEPQPDTAGSQSQKITATAHPLPAETQLQKPVKAGHQASAEFQSQKPVTAEQSQQAETKPQAAAKAEQSQQAWSQPRISVKPQADPTSQQAEPQPLCSVAAVGLESQTSHMSQQAKPQPLCSVAAAGLESQTSHMSQQAKPQPRKLSAGGIVAIAVAAAIVLFVASMFIFKETFMPLWEQLLYTPEELQYLRDNL